MWLTKLLARKPESRVPLYLYNTLEREKQRFSLPKGASSVRMYNCGPTVYDVQHIGNLSMYVFTDVLRRVLEYNGFTVKQVINITDLGHLTSDRDAGEDKMSIGLRREGMALTLENMRLLGERYTKIFQEDLMRLNIDTSRIVFPRASEYIAAQIAMIQTLEEKGYAYRAEDGIYFDTRLFQSYGELGGVTESSRSEARIESKASKRSPSDFALWKFSARGGSASGGSMGWDSPFGQGFPGWHIECSAMIRATLGQQIDIHTGGIEHIPVHHNNEIAQSEAVTGRRPLSRFWLHRAHIQLEGSKLAKSAGRVVYLSEIIRRGFHPLALRYLLLGAHYRTPSNFTWDALAAAQTAFLRLRRSVSAAPTGGTPPKKYKKMIHECLNDDLDTPGALGAMWEMVKDLKRKPADIRAGILDADKVFGLSLAMDDASADAAIAKQFGEPVPEANLPNEVKEKLKERQGARLIRNWERADAIRKELAESGFTLEDYGRSTIVYRRR